MEGTTNMSKVFKCQSCSHESKLKSNLALHVKAVHDRIKDFECDQCTYTASSKGDLTRHVKRVHDKIKDFECDQCSFTAYSERELTLHAKRVHDRIKDFECDQCSFTASSKGNLTIHVKRVHNRIKDFNCDQCTYTASSKGYLTQHVKRVHDRIRNFECDQCSFTAYSKGGLNRHLKICTGKSSMSSMELKMKQVLDELKIEHMYNSTHDNLRNSAGNYLRFDFIVPTLDESYFMIEMNGQQHYGPVQFGGMDKDQALENFERQLAHDGLKRAYCAKNNYPLLEVKYNDDREYRVILEEFISESQSPELPQTSLGYQEYLNLLKKK